MKFSRVLFFVFACFAAFTVTAAKPWDFLKELEGAGQRIRDAIISAQPAVETIAQATAIFKGQSKEED
ncbi:hypothetical protein O3G_MSEX015012 [Manduca sexta]|uniref:Cecropin 6 n=2 Tax=Manduca sexta TaxID=7130 RepID=Q86MA0_MANSE|nr:antimicrobial peptide cecropin 6 [Manduca sexta]KAG6465231.1 hypothetical protein O3G_MSEX015012 [Manduca sexta]KAG6465232.1 hypothetical protein O3G_MSEX015012 [Manduca sexta]CAL25128.1 cecropin 6 [Manduca sexta]